MSELKEKLQSVTRTERKIYKKNSEYLTLLMAKFFGIANGKSEKDILKLFEDYDKNWTMHVSKWNRKIGQAYLDYDAFEDMIKDKAIKQVKVADTTAKAKLQMIRTIRIVKGKFNLLTFIADIPLWWKFYFNERTALHTK